MKFERNNQIALLVILTLTVILTIRISMYPPLDEIEFGDVVGELLLGVLVFIWFILAQHTVHYKKVFLPLVIGFGLFFLGTFEDILDEFFNVGNTLGITTVENIIWIGMILIGIGLYKWSKITDQTENLLKSNKLLQAANKKVNEKENSLKETEKRLNKKEKELKETLDQLYTYRVAAVKEMRKGDFEKANQKIKQKIDELNKL